MRSLAVRLLGRPIGRLVALLLRLSARPVGVALMYHAVAERGGDPDRELVPPHSRALFEAQLRHLRGAYRLVPASRLLDEVAHRRRGQRIPVAITFDDDLACHRAVSVPVLERLGVPATFFLSGASLDGPYSFWWERLQRAVAKNDGAVPALDGVAPARLERADPSGIHATAAAVQGLAPERRDAVAEGLLAVAGPDPADAGMRADDVRALAAAGCEVSFHTRRHHALTGLDDDALAQAMREGRDTLADISGQPVEVISYPHGRADARVADAAAGAGYRIGFTNRFGKVTTGDHPLLLARVEPSFLSAGHLALRLANTMVRAA